MSYANNIKCQKEKIITKKTTDSMIVNKKGFFIWKSKKRKGNLMVIGDSAEWQQKIQNYACI